MWILPKQLHTLDSVQDTEALSLDLQESSQLCAQSLFVRSKPSPLRTWLQKWKRDSWSQHLYGRILKPSLGKAFETEWTSLLEATPANHSPQQASEQERKTQDTCGLGSQTELGFCDQECASSKMSKDTSRWDSPASSATWKSWVTRCRGEYSARLKSAHLTNGSGYLSWPTMHMGINERGAYYDKTGKGQRCLSDAVVDEQKNWPTATTRDWKGCGNAVQRKDGKHRLDTLEAVVMFGLPAPVNPSTDGSRLESWGTPRSCSAMAATISQEAVENTEKRYQSNLETQMVTRAGAGAGAKLNPRWVETLMGLPIGWTMPSCTRPVIIAPMNCDCLETESSQPPPNEHLEH